MNLAVLGMYPFPQLREPLDRLWAAIVERVPDLPARLDHDHSLHDSWHDDGLVIGQTCGWPLVTELRDEVIVLGAFSPRVPFAGDGRYRSVLVSRAPLSAAEWAARDDLVVAVNGLDSLSGWVSLCASLDGRPAEPLLTGAHVASLHAVAERRADLASIDSKSFEFALEIDALLGARLHVVGHGPVVPALPLITSRAFADRRDEFRAALAGAVSDPALAGVSAALRIGSFVPFDLADYLELEALDPARRPVLSGRRATN